MTYSGADIARNARESLGEALQALQSQQGPPRRRDGGDAEHRPGRGRALRSRARLERARREEWRQERARLVEPDARAAPGCAFGAPRDRHGHGRAGEHDERALPLDHRAVAHTATGAGGARYGPDGPAGRGRTARRLGADGARSLTYPFRDARPREPCACSGRAGAGRTAAPALVHSVPAPRRRAAAGKRRSEHRRDHPVELLRGLQRRDRGRLPRHLRGAPPQRAGSMRSSRCPAASSSAWTAGYASCRDPFDLTSDSEPGMGIQFESIDPHSRDLALRFIRKRPPMFYDD